MGATHSRKKKEFVKEGRRKKSGEENGSVDNAEAYKAGGDNKEQKESIQINHPKSNIFDYKLRSIRIKYENGVENKNVNTNVSKCYKEEDYTSEFNPFGTLENYPQSLDPFASEEENLSVNNPFESDNIANALGSNGCEQENENNSMVNNIVEISDEEENNSGDPVNEVKDNRNNLIDPDAVCNEIENFERFAGNQINSTNEYVLLIADDNKNKSKYSVGDKNIMHNSPNEPENTSNKIRDNKNNNLEDPAIDVSDNHNTLVTSRDAIENCERFDNSKCDVLIKDDKNKSKATVGDKNVIHKLFNESEDLSNTISGKENSNLRDPAIDVFENRNSSLECHTSLTTNDDKNKSEDPLADKIIIHKPLNVKSSENTCNTIENLKSLENGNAMPLPFVSLLKGYADKSNSQNKDIDYKDSINIISDINNTETEAYKVSKPPSSNSLVIHQGKNKKTISRYKKKYRAPNPPNMELRTRGIESKSLITSSTTSSSKEIPDIKQSKEVINHMPSDSKSSVSHEEPLRKSISYRAKKHRAPDPPDKFSTMKNAEFGIRHRIHRAAPPPPVAIPVNPNNVSPTSESTQPNNILPTNNCRRKSFRRIISDLFKRKKKSRKDKENMEKLEKSKKSRILKSCD